MTGSGNGIVSLWKKKKIDKSTKISDNWTLVLFKEGQVFAASKNNVVELNLNLEVAKKFKSRQSKPFTMDANENYLVVGYESGAVDVHNRKQLDRGETQKRMVSDLY